MKKSQARWFENLMEGRDHALRLFCFPYAGGNAQVYRNWQRDFPAEVSLSLAHLPGRGARIGEAPFRECRELVNALAEAITPQLPPVFAFWGHSMGALVTFELARELRRRGRPTPLALFVSGRGAPQIPDPSPPAFNLPDQDFIAELRRLNGTPRELLDHPELAELFLPTIRADFELIETYVYKPEAPLACAIYAYGGLEDETIPAAELKAWQKQTSVAFKVRMFPGDHFYIHTSRDLVPTLRRDALDLLMQRATGHRPAQELNL
jgi:medium-chain acyl-[acyl-carrier-protein] hydrolase